MVKEITFFLPKDIEPVTGLSREDLRDAGFVLDDMDFGFILNEPPGDDPPLLYPLAAIQRRKLLRRL